MSENEILELFNYRDLSKKTSNYVFSEIKNLNIMDSIPEKCRISFVGDYIDYAEALNIKINLKKIEIENILAYCLNALKDYKMINSVSEYKMKFNNEFDLLKFHEALSIRNLTVQLIFYNIENLKINDLKLINEIYRFNSFTFTVNTFTKGNDLKTYYNKKIEDSENYIKVKVLNKV